MVELYQVFEWTAEDRRRSRKLYNWLTRHEGHEIEFEGHRGTLRNVERIIRGNYIWIWFEIEEP